MGLAAGQARLLSITTRKSDCEFQSMNLSHQKLAISRELEDVSNKYQNSLEQTKLVYDYYGSGDESTPLTYDLLMTPSALNDYIPKLLTDTSGRVVLDAKYAEAAKAAGIPKEGLGNGSLPSETVRNKFIDALGGNGTITETQRQAIEKVPYDQNAGFGEIASVKTLTADVDYADLEEKLKSKVYSMDWSESVYAEKDSANDNFTLMKKVGDTWTELDKNTVTIGDLMDENAEYYATYMGGDGLNEYNKYFENWTEHLPFENLIATLTGVFDAGDQYTEAALNYAKQNVTALYKGSLADETETAGDIINENIFARIYKHKNYWTQDKTFNDLKDYLSDSNNGSIGVTFLKNKGGDFNSRAGVNLSSFTKAFLTYYQSYLEGLTKTTYKVGKSVTTSDFVGTGTIFKVVADEQVSEDNQKLAGFYDTLFNMICKNGWTENDNVDDKDYMKKMLQNGGMLLTTMDDDKYYYQRNYSSDSNIKEVEDSTAVAEAEANYNTQKARLSNKEDTLDLKMKNLDTEISALTTEYDTVKSAISKNIERSFKRYSA